MYADGLAVADEACCLTMPSVVHRSEPAYAGANVIIDELKVR